VRAIAQWSMKAVVGGAKKRSARTEIRLSGAVRSGTTLLCSSQCGCGLKDQLPGLQIGDTLGQVQDFNAHYLILGVVIQDHAWRYFLRLDDRGFIQTQIKRIGFLVNV
jgi:hypothetical protein